MARGFAVRAALSVAALSVLAACSVFEGATVSCPTVDALDDARQLTRFKDGGSDLTDIEFEAQVGSLAAECRFDEDTRVGSIDLDILFRAQRGPAGPATEHGFRYFVAVVDPAGGVAVRKAFSVQVPFEGSGTEISTEEALRLDIPTGENASLASYRVYVGMELTKDQFERNLGRRSGLPSG